MAEPRPHDERAAISYNEVQPSGLQGQNPWSRGWSWTLFCIITSWGVD